MAYQARVPFDMALGEEPGLVQGRVVEAPQAHDAHYRRLGSATGRRKHGQDCLPVDRGVD